MSQATATLPAKPKGAVPTHRPEPVMQKFQVELGFPRNPDMQPVLTVEATSEDEAKAILIKWFKDRLRIVKG